MSSELHRLNPVCSDARQPRPLASRPLRKAQRGTQGKVGGFMKLRDGHRGPIWMLGAGALAVAFGASPAHAQMTPVANANPKTVGFAAPNVLSPDFVGVVVA